MNTVFIALLLAVSAPAPDTVVVCAPAFEKALQPWVQYRQAQGHVISVVSNAGTAAEIRARIREQAKSGKLKHVLLVGDAPVPSAKQLRVPLFGVPLLAASSAPLPTTSSDNVFIPAHYVPSKITLRWGSEPLIATDNYYADLDDDLAPDLAIGRLTADSPVELSAMIQKIIAYEQNDDFGPWRTRINFVAGTGGFGAAADKLLERVAGSVITQYIPATYNRSMTYACWQNPFCPNPQRFQQSVIERLNEGCAFWVYIGHGHERGVAGVSLSPEFRWDSIFSAEQVKQIKPQGGPAIAMFLACRTGAYDKSEDCLAEELLRAPDGPVAVMSGSRVTMPYAMTVLGMGMMSETFDNRRATLGEAFLHAKRRLVPARSARRVGLATVIAMSKSFELLPDDVLPLTKATAAMRLARLVGTLPADLMQERAEHVALFNLFGDPLLRLRYPQPIELAIPARAQAGEEIVVSGSVDITAHNASVRNGPRGAPGLRPTSPEGAAANQRDARQSDNVQARIEILLPPVHYAANRTERGVFDPSDAALAAYDATYRRANDGVIATAFAPLSNGQFRAAVRLPADASGHCQVRVVLESAAHFAAGAREIHIDSPAAGAR